ncbi:YhdP family protein [Chitinibacter tainanensis]|uniref:YhdP family protein n=1 Tax=Chitinibacter tainanensis TaxID=230667 RepID=UPI002357DCFF|nr:YhdP family protein [Chitinibacter tainanensis]
MSMVFLTRLKTLGARFSAWHLRWLKRCLLSVLLLLALLALGWQTWLIPRLNSYKPWLETRLSQSTGLPIQIGRLSGGWQGIRPQLTLEHFTARNSRGEVALEFARMQGALSWWRLALGQLHFSSLTLLSPELVITRLANGQWQIGGITLPQNHSDSGDHQLLNWLIAQGEVEIRQGRLQLRDARGLWPALHTRDLQLTMHNWFGRHRWLLRLRPEQLLDTPLELQARLSGDDVGDLADWSGTVALNLPKADLARLAPWLAPLSPQAQFASGKGALKLEFELDEGALAGLDADLQLSDWQIRFAHWPTFSLPQFAGQFSWQQQGAKQSFTLRGQRIVGTSGVLCQGCQLNWQRDADGQSLRASAWQLAGLNAYAAYLPAPLASWRNAKLGGELSQLQLAWPGHWPWRAGAPLPSWRSLQGELAASNLSASQLPGALAWQNLNLDAEFKPDSGRLKLGGDGVQISYPAEFSEGLQFDRLASEWQWQRAGQGWQLQLQGLKASNRDLALDTKASYRWPGQGLGQVDLQATIARLAANRVHAYLPREIGDDVLHWLKDSLKGGEARNAQFVWRGEVADFPYPANTPAAQRGVFRVVTDARDVTLNYGADWPDITGIQGQVEIQGTALQVRAQQGNITGTQLHEVKVDIPQLDHDPHVLVTGKVSGKTADYLEFVAKSPVRQAMNGFLDRLQAQGHGELSLRLDIPVENIDATQVEGQYRFAGNRLDFGAGIPVLEQARGEVHFTEHELKVLPSSARALGGQVQLSGANASNGDLQLQLKGDADVQRAMQEYAPALATGLKGMVPFQAQLAVSPAHFELNLNSDLAGAAISLPAPLTKAQGQRRPFKLRLADQQGQSRLEFSYDQALNAALLLGDEASQLRGQLNLGHARSPAAKAQLNEQAKGIQIAGSWPNFSAEHWLALAGVSEGPSSGASNLPPILLQNVGFDELDIWGQRLTDVRLNAQLQPKAVQAHLQSQQMSGEVNWQLAQHLVQAKLSKLWLPLKSVPTAERLRPAALTVAPAVEESLLPTWQRFPALQLTASDFRVNGVEFGALKINSKPQANGIDFNELSLRNADGEVQLSGAWLQQGSVEKTQASLRIESENTGKLLKRLGYPEALKDAPLQLQGEGQWQGAPWAPRWSSVNGKLALNVGAGQFLKLDPGVGRFLSVLSLQALPRRLKLDFSDVFSNGLEFDRIRGDVLIEQGVARTNNLHIDSPAAKIRFTGDANFIANTQNLRVRIVPSISGAVALGVTVVNPLAGLATLAVQSALDNPLGELVAYEFQIEGSMSEPKIRKVGVQPAKPKDIASGILRKALD